ncbi:MAG: DUF6629 family protein [Pseudobdellovibrio sp.]
MCFSANASFGSAVVLISLGTSASLINQDETQKMFTAIPLLFGIQQLAEGIVWLTIDRGEMVFLNQLSLIIYLIFALIYWPVWLPLSVLKIEQNMKRKKFIRILAGFGMIASVYSFWLLLSGAPQANVVGHSIKYSFLNWENKFPLNYYLIGYLIPSVLPLFVATFQYARTIGYLIISGLLLTLLIRNESVTSVWCFFSAIISLFIAFNSIRSRYLVTEVIREDIN